jgi:uncharacterized protein YneF (UPF0154 family)
MNKNLILIIILLIFVGVGGFFGGMKYGESQALKNLTPEKMREIFQQTRGQFQTKRQRIAQGFILGEVISKDEKSLTVKLPDGSTRIVFLSESTQILKSVQGNIQDIEIGKQVIVSGEQTTEGSLTAKTIQIR